MACRPREVVEAGAAVIVDWVEAEDDASCAKSCAVESIYDDLIPCWDCARFSTERDALVALPDGDEESGGDGKREAPPLDDEVFWCFFSAAAGSLIVYACDDDDDDEENRDVAAGCGGGGDVVVEEEDDENDDVVGACAAAADLCARAGLDEDEDEIEDCWREGASLDRLVDR